MDTMEILGLCGHGDRLKSEDLGVAVDFIDTAHRRLDRERLLSLGVSEEIVEKARVTKQLKPHVRFSRLIKGRPN